VPGAHDHGARPEATDAEQRDLGSRTVIGAVLSFPVFVIAMSHGAPYLHRFPGGDPALNWLQFALTTPVIAWCGGRFFVSAWQGLKHVRANMDTLVALGTGAAYVFSSVATIAPQLFPVTSS